MSTAQPDDRRARHNVHVLIGAQAVLGAQMPIAFVLGGLSGQMLSPYKCLATLPISLIVLTTMVAAPALSSFMQLHGRRAGFVIGAGAGALGGGLSALGLLMGSFPVFLLGSLGTGIYMAAQAFYRFAAADTASEGYRPRAISYVMAGGLISAIIGPQLVKLSGGWTDPVPFAGGYLAIVALNAAGVFIFAFLDIPKPEPRANGHFGGRSRRELLKSPRILVAMICAMVTYALMNLVMTSTPLAVVGSGFTTNHAADVVSAHVLAMFVPSFFTGHLIARFGPERIIGLGLLILAGAGAVALNGVTLGHFFTALVLLGLGWNFGFIGATTLLAGAHTGQERGRVQGLNDFMVFGLVSVASLSSGLLMNCTGYEGAGGWTAVNLAMLPLLLVAGAALTWLVLRPKARTA